MQKREKLGRLVRGSPGEIDGGDTRFLQGDPKRHYIVIAIPTLDIFGGADAHQ